MRTLEDEIFDQMEEFEDELIFWNREEWNKLSDRQFEVFFLLSLGFSQSHIASVFNLSRQRVSQLKNKAKKIFYGQFGGY